MDVPVAAAQTPARVVGLPLRMLGDERLARLIKTGHDAAFAVLYERHHQALYRYCRSLVGNDADAQDALQSALAGALVALRDGRRNAPLRPWLYRIAHNESISLLRRRRPEQELPAEIPQTERAASDVAEERARLAALMADLRELPEQQRGALVMRELSGLSHQEVAQALGISLGAAKQTVLEARRSLLEFSEGRAMSCEQVQRTVSDGDGRALRGRKIRAHLRECPACSAFTAAIPARRADLLAISPALPGAVAAALLARLTGAGSGSAGGGGAGIAAGLTGKGLTTAVSGKLLATGAALVATAAVGATGVVQHLATGTARPHPQAVPVTHHAAARGSSATAHAHSAAALSRAARRAGHAGGHAAATGNGAGHHHASHAGARGAANGQRSAGGGSASARHSSAPGRSSAPGHSSASGRSSSAGSSSARSGAVSHGVNGQSTSARHRSTPTHPASGAGQPTHPAKGPQQAPPAGQNNTQHGNGGTGTTTTEPSVLTVPTATQSQSRSRRPNRA